MPAPTLHVASSLLLACIFLSSLLTAVVSSNVAMPTHVVFSDVDGTLVHYPNHLQRADAATTDAASSDLIYLPPSKTGTRGVLSKRTLELCHTLRTGASRSSLSSNQASISIRKTAPLVLISGMRSATLFQRLPYLPRADAYVSESGGRIFYPVSIDKLNSRDGVVNNLVIQPHYSNEQDGTPFGLVEDLEWRNQITKLDAAGSDGFNNDLPIEQRKGKLWEYATQLIQRGYTLDTLGYTTAFRINKKMQSTLNQDIFDSLLQSIGDEIPNGLGHSTNLGCIDVYPIMSGKKNCCEYLVRRFCGQDAHLNTNAYCMCDDDNDVEMATACKIAYLPSVTSVSVRRMIERQRDDAGALEYERLVVTEDSERGIVETTATERALEMILNELWSTENISDA